MHRSLYAHTLLYFFFSTYHTCTLSREYKRYENSSKQGKWKKNYYCCCCCDYFVLMALSWISGFIKIFIYMFKILCFIFQPHRFLSIFTVSIKIFVYFYAYDFSFAPPPLITNSITIITSNKNTSSNSNISPIKISDRLVLLPKVSVL